MNRYDIALGKKPPEKTLKESDVDMEKQILKEYQEFLKEIDVLPILRGYFELHSNILDK